MRTLAALQAGMPPLNRPIRIDAPKLNTMTVGFTLRFCKKIMSLKAEGKTIAPALAPSVPNAPPMRAMNTYSASISLRANPGLKPRAFITATSV